MNNQVLKLEKQISKLSLFEPIQKEESAVIVLEFSIFDSLSEELDEYVLLDTEEEPFGQTDIHPVQSEENFSWFLEPQSNEGLYSNSLLNSTNSFELYSDNEPELGFNEGNSSTETVDLAQNQAENQNQTITVGNSGRTQFTFNFASDTPQEVVEGVEQAAEIWSSLLGDDVNVTINFSFEEIEASPGRTTLGSAESTSFGLPYNLVREALAGDVSSLDDRTAIANLPNGDSIDILINNTSENSGSDTPYLDNNGSENNSNIELTTANAKALGIGLEDLATRFDLSPEAVAEQANVDLNAPDANITINSEINWDFDRSDGIDADAYDFIGIVIHEIGHALGFTSRANTLDTFAGKTIGELIEFLGREEVSQLVGESGLDPLVNEVAADQFISENVHVPHTLDLFRFTPESFQQGAIDLTTGNIGDKYFSIDGGQTEIATLSTGRLTGDGEQLSHWQDNLNIGIMDPTVDNGELLQISEIDLIGFDVIGWDIV